jgi:hypothetical protein
MTRAVNNRSLRVALIDRSPQANGHPSVSAFAEITRSWSLMSARVFP